ncbi:MAG: single-stranded DNA-binding protein [Patescibacteria group bacterium]|nr:single-stranded DNA-binding protein [Patescibacteria group bacterium]
MYLNKALVYGNLTRDPELRAIPSGSKVATFAVATNRTWKDKAGARQDAVDYHNIVVFGRQAETVSQYLKKGSAVMVEGRMQTRSWDADGVKKYRTEIVADYVQFGPRGSTSPSANTATAPKDDANAPVPAEAPADAIEYPEEEINPDDIPF